MDRVLTAEDIDWLRKLRNAKASNHPSPDIPTRFMRPEFVYARLLDLDVVGLDHLGPALGFAADLLVQPLGRAADEAQPGFFQARLDARVPDGRVERRVQFLHRRARGALRHHETVPGFDDEALVPELFH